MSPDSLRNPFHPPDQRTGTPSELTRHLLPSADAQALAEALGEEEPSKSEPQQDLPPADISMSGKEQKEVEKEPYWTKDQYIEWAEDFGKDEAWVDEIFKFQPDGTTVVNGELNLRNTKIKQLPIGLIEAKEGLSISYNPSLKLNGYPKKVEGDFYCSNNGLSTLEGMPKEVGGGISFGSNNLHSLVGLSEKVNGDLDLFGNKLVHLKDLSKEIQGSLLLQKNPLGLLDDLVGTKIGFDLYLWDIPATKIPAGIEIGGCIYIESSQTDLIADAKRKGYQVRLV